MNAENPQPEIDYPCQWDYSIIAIDEKSARMAVVAAVGSATHNIKSNSTSSGGKYISLKIDVIVEDRQHRDRIFAMLKNSDGVKFVM